MRATRVKPAVLPQPGAEQVTIAAYEGNQDFLHCRSTLSHNCCSEARREAACALPALGLAITTMSKPSSFSWQLQRLTYLALDAVSHYRSGRCLARDDDPQAPVWIWIGNRVNTEKIIAPAHAALQGRREPRRSPQPV